jgi:hypothetical protein
VILSYYALPIDLLGNPGVPSDTLMVGTYDFRSTAAFTEIRTQSMDSIGGIRIAWRLSDARFVSTVQVQRSSKWDGTYSTLTELPSSDTSFTDQTTQPMAEYFYRLLTTGPLGELSEPSARVYGLFQSSESPLPPVEVFATGIQNGVRIEWKNPDDHIAGVYLYRMGGGSDSLSLLTPLLPLSGKRNVYVDSSGLSGRHVYGYALRSENTSHVWSSLSDTVYARPQIPTNPLAPMEFSVSLDGTTARLFWMDMPLLDETVEGYILSRREVSGGKRKPGPFRPLHDTLLTRNYATDSLERGRMYEFAIQSVDAFGGRSDLIASNVVSVERTNSPPPQGIRVTPIRTGILVKWDLPSGDGVTSLRLYRYERGRAATRLAELKATAEEFTDRKAAKGVLYFYYLTSVSIDGSESPASEDAGGRR